MTENSELEGQLTVEDVLSAAQEAEYHTVLELWMRLLEPAEVERIRRVTPQWANRIVNTYREIGFADMIYFREAYFGKVLELAAIIAEEIEDDTEALKATSPEEDVAHNQFHYLNIITNWQLVFMSWELEWDCTDEWSAVDLAVISEVHKMFFDQNGITNLLDQINFQVTDGDKEYLTEQIADMVEEATRADMALAAAQSAEGGGE